MKNEMELISEAVVEQETAPLPGIAVDTHFDFRLEGWPASAVLMTLCLSCVMIYGITVWGKTRAIPVPATAS